jgi:hypothetical protein
MNDRVEAYGRPVRRWEPAGRTWNRLGVLAILAALLAGAPCGYSQSALPTYPALSVGSGSGQYLYNLSCTVTGPQTASGGTATGSVSFNDLLAGNVMGTAPFGPPTLEPFAAIAPTTTLPGAVYGSIVTADFNGDGKPDIAYVDGPAGELYVLLGNGDGTFQAPKATAIPTGEYGSLVTGAFAGGTTVDVAIPYGLSSTGVVLPTPEVLVLIGNNDGTFQAPVAYPVGGRPTAIAVADLRGIGKLDLAVSVLGNIAAGPGFVSVLLGNGDGTFQPQVSYPAGSTPRNVIAGPLPSPGPVNLLVLSGETITLLTGNGDGTFGPGQAIQLPFYAFTAAVGDFNNDGIEDLAVEGSDPSTYDVRIPAYDVRIDVLFGAQTGSAFGSESTVAVIPGATGIGSLVAEDFTGSGDLDLAFPYLSVSSTDGRFIRGNMQVLFGNGTGAFPSSFGPPPYPHEPQGMVAGDFNGDGYPDLALATHYQLTVYIGHAFTQSAQVSNVQLDTAVMGTHELDCAYGGDSNYAASTSPQNSVIPLPVGGVNLPIDATTRSNAVAQSDSVLITGWAGDPHLGGPVAGVQVYIDGNYVGEGEGASFQPAVVAATHNYSYYDTGWTFTYPAGGLAIGRHTATAAAIDTRGLEAQLTTRRFTVAAAQTWTPPFGSVEGIVDATTRSTTVAQSDSLLVSGWAADAHDGAPVSSVSILVDGKSVGTATLGIARPDIVTRFNNALYLSSGWTLTVSAAGFSIGPHTVSAVATDTLGLSATLGSETITVATTPVDGPPFGSLEIVDAANGGTVVSREGSLFAAGWAADYHDGAPVQQVSILLDGKAVGNAMLGFGRPDVAKKIGARYTNSGWEFTMSASRMAIGLHTVTAIATDSLGHSTQFRVAGIWVEN